jgi:hypothetical protein
MPPQLNKEARETVRQCLKLLEKSQERLTLQAFDLLMGLWMETEPQGKPQPPVPLENEIEWKDPPKRIHWLNGGGNDPE